MQYATNVFPVDLVLTQKAPLRIKEIWKILNMSFGMISPTTNSRFQIKKKNLIESYAIESHLYFFKIIQPIDTKLGMCNKFPVYFQLSIVTWYIVIIA